MGNLYLIIVNYKNDKKTLSLLNSLPGIKYLVQIIVIDNSKSEKLEEEIPSISPKITTKLKLIKNRQNIGFAAGVNLGIKKALNSAASQIILLNPDISIDSAKLLKLTQYKNGDLVSPILKFKRNEKQVYTLGGRINWFIGQSYHEEVLKLPAELGNSEMDYISGACMVIKREVYEKIGLFDERFFMYFEDVDFCLRAKQAGFKVRVNQNVIVDHDISEHRYSLNEFKIRQNLKSNFLFIQKWVPWYFKPTAYAYFCLLTSWVFLKIAVNKTARF